MADTGSVLARRYPQPYAIIDYQQYYHYLSSIMIDISWKKWIFFIFLHKKNLLRQTSTKAGL